MLYIMAIAILYSQSNLAPTLHSLITYPRDVIFLFTLWYKQIILKNFTTIAKLLFLLNATMLLRSPSQSDFRYSTYWVVSGTESCHRERSDKRSSQPCTGTDYLRPQSRNRHRVRAHGCSVKPETMRSTTPTTRTLCSESAASAIRIIIRMITLSTNKQNQSRPMWK